MSSGSVFAQVFRSRRCRRQKTSRGSQGVARNRGQQTIAPQAEQLEPRLALAKTVGLFVNETAKVSPGYTLFGNSFSRSTHLIDTSGEVVQTWTGSGGQTSSYLLPNGNLLRNTNTPAGRVFGSNGSTGVIEELAWDSSVVWTFDMQTEKYQLHHDAIPMPNGNILAMAWERHSYAEAVAMGRNPALTNPANNREVWSEAIFEIKPDRTDGIGGDIVWEWHLSDHLIQNLYPGKPDFGAVRLHPEKVNLNYVPTGIGADTHIADWAHFNAIAYNPKTDQIMVSSREFSEVWMIDHSTTSEQAAGHTGGRYGKGGDLLWRYGNTASWNLGTRANQQLYFQHNVQWIADGSPGAGNILVFNNGWNRATGGSFSSVMELKPVRYGVAQRVWVYAANPPARFFAPIVSGAQRLPNGNTLIDEGTTGRIFEVTRAGRIVWQYVNPDTMTGPLKQGVKPPLRAVTGLNGTPNVRGNMVFRAVRYAPSFEGLTGKTLTPRGTIEK